MVIALVGNNNHTGDTLIMENHQENKLETEVDTYIVWGYRPNVITRLPRCAPLAALATEAPDAQTLDCKPFTLDRLHAAPIPEIYLAPNPVT